MLKLLSPRHRRSLTLGIVSGITIVIGVVAFCAFMCGCGSAVSIKAGSNRASESITTTDPATGQQKTHTRTVEATGGESNASGEDAAKVAAQSATGGVELDPLGGIRTGPSTFAGKASATSEAVRWLLYIAAVIMAGLCLWSLYQKRLPCAVAYLVKCAALCLCIWIPAISDLVLIAAILYAAGHTEYAGQLLSKAKARAGSLIENTAKMVRGISALDAEIKSTVKEAMTVAGVNESIVAEAKAVKP